MNTPTKMSVSLRYLDYLLERKEYRTIYSSPQIFRDLYFKVYYQNQKTSPTKLHLIYLSWPSELFLTIVKILEVIRLCVLTASQLKTDLIFVYQSDFDVVFLDEIQIGLSDWSYRIDTVLENLLASIGITINTEEFPEESFLRFQVNGKFEREYLLPPISINPRDLSKKFYQLYQKGVKCDFTIQASDESLIKLHKMIILSSEENIILSMLGEENEGDFIRLDFSSTVLRVMVDFLYLGPTAITPDRVVKEKIDMDELFRLADFLAMEEFISHCINLYNTLHLNYTPEEFCSLAERYDNVDLKELALARPSVAQRKNGPVRLVLY